ALLFRRIRVQLKIGWQGRYRRQAGGGDLFLLLLDIPAAEHEGHLGLAGVSGVTLRRPQDVLERRPAGVQLREELTAFPAFFGSELAKHLGGRGDAEAMRAGGSSNIICAEGSVVELRFFDFAVEKSVGGPLVPQTKENTRVT